MRSSLKVKIIKNKKCGVCKRTNERLLQHCWNCKKHTEQSLMEEKLSDMISETMDQKFQCKSCGEINETSRDSDEHVHRFLSGMDESGGVWCNYCMRNKKQELIDKKQSKLNPKYDLTTYKCKTCGTENYGFERKRDVR